MPKLVYQKAQLMSIELQIKIDPKDDKLFKIYFAFVKQIEECNVHWEKPFFKLA